MIVGRSRKGPPRTRPDKPITVSVLRAALQTMVLGKDLKLPDDAALNELARALEHWRRGFQNEETAQRRSKLQETAMLGLVAAKDAVFQLQELDRKSFAEEIRQIERISRSPGIWNATSYIGKSAAWNWLGGVLPVDFATAMKSTNPTFKPKISQGGPVARFVAAVVPLITGEHPTVASAAVKLKKMRGASRQDR
jgi:hypothetical protein